MQHYDSRAGEMGAGRLRFLTYLSPGIPQAFYKAVVQALGRSLDLDVSLASEMEVSGPAKGSDDPFSRGTADVGFVCAPSLFWLREGGKPAVELVGAAPVFRERRAPGRPVYYSEVIVRRESQIRTFSQLRGGSWAYNDPCSLSGYFSLLKRLAEKGESDGYFDHVRRSGSHLDSIRMVASGVVDAAAIDSNVLRIVSGSDARLGYRLRVIESWGPFPIQPIVARASLPRDLGTRLRAALLSATPTAELAAYGFEGFAPVSYEDYALEERFVLGCEYRGPATLG